MDSSNLTIQNEELCLANFKFESCNELLRSFITVKDMLYQFEIQLKTSFVKLQCKSCNVTEVVPIKIDYKKNVKRK